MHNPGKSGAKLYLRWDKKNWNLTNHEWVSWLCSSVLTKCMWSRRWPRKRLRKCTIFWNRSQDGWKIAVVTYPCSNQSWIDQIDANRVDPSSKLTNKSALVSPVHCGEGRQDPAPPIPWHVQTHRGQRWELHVRHEERLQRSPEGRSR